MRFLALNRALGPKAPSFPHENGHVLRRITVPKGLFGLLVPNLLSFLPKRWCLVKATFRLCLSNMDLVTKEIFGNYLRKHNNEVPDKVLE